MDFANNIHVWFPRLPFLPSYCLCNDENSVLLNKQTVTKTAQIQKFKNIRYEYTPTALVTQLTWIFVKTTEDNFEQVCFAPTKRSKNTAAVDLIEFTQVSANG